MQKRMRNQKGFTLVEIAIVLVIVGLLIGGILKGQEMVKSGKIKRSGKQIEDIKAAVNSFQDKYRGAMPGSGAAGNMPSNDVFADLAAGGMLAYSGTMLNTYGGAVTAAFSGGTITVKSAGIPDFAARKIDLAQDDGIGTTGDILGAAAPAGQAFASDDTTENTTARELNVLIR